MTDAGIFCTQSPCPNHLGARCRSIQGSTQTLQRLELPDGDFVDILGARSKRGRPNRGFSLWS